MQGLQDKYQRLSYAKRLLLLLGVPAILAFLIYKYEPFESDSSLGVLIIVLLWWLTVFGWLNYLDQKDFSRKLVLKITQLKPEVREDLISETDFQLEGDAIYHEKLDEITIEKAEKFIRKIERAPVKDLEEPSYTTAK